MRKNAQMPASPNPGMPHAIGLTKRELIAAMAMQGLLSGGILGWGDVDQRADAVAQRAARQADALLAELERRDD